MGYAVSPWSQIAPFWKRHLFLWTESLPPAHFLLVPESISCLLLRCCQLLQAACHGSLIMQHISAAFQIVDCKLVLAVFLWNEPYMGFDTFGNSHYSDSWESLQGSSDGFEIWPISGISEYFVRPFTQTIRNMVYLISNNTELLCWRFKWYPFLGSEDLPCWKDR